MNEIISLLLIFNIILIDVFLFIILVPGIKKTDEDLTFLWNKVKKIKKGDNK